MKMTELLTVYPISVSLKVPSMNAADDIHKYFFIVFFSSEKMRLDISCESSARHRIHKKHLASFSFTDNSKK